MFKEINPPFTEYLSYHELWIVKLDALMFSTNYPVAFKSEALGFYFKGKLIVSGDLQVFCKVFNTGDDVLPGVI